MWWKYLFRDQDPNECQIHTAFDLISFHTAFNSKGQTQNCLRLGHEIESEQLDLKKNISFGNAANKDHDGTVEFVFTLVKITLMPPIT